MDGSQPAPEKTSAGEVMPPQKPVAPKPQLAAGERILPVIPTTIEETYRYAQVIIRAGLAPSSYEFEKGVLDKDGHQLTGPDPEKVMIGILKSLEVGLPPITGLSSIAIINKRPCIWGDGAMALVQKAGVVDRYEVVEVGPKPEEGANVGIEKFTNAYGFRCSIWRKHQATPYVGEFTVADAKRAGLWGNAKRQPWMLYPKRMLRNRAVAFALRDGFSDCLAGLQIREEVEDIPAPPPEKPNTSFLDDDRPVRTIEHKPEAEPNPWRIGDELEFGAEFARLLAEAVEKPEDVEALVKANEERITPELAEAAEKRRQELAQ